MESRSEELRARFLDGLRKDKLFASLGQEEQIRLCREAEEAGIRYAEEAGRKISSRDFAGLSDWLAGEGVSVERLDTKYQLPYIAEYEELKKKITLYTRRIEHMQRTLMTVHPEYFESHSLEEMCLAHEAFHFLEKRDHRTTGRLIRTDRKLLGFIPVRHYYAEGSEIAAHVFVTELLDLPFSPYTMVDEAVAVWNKEKESGNAE